jgi:outer membrane receptor protein involved in Fe transport
VNYAGGRSSNVVDQYATVPTDAVRGGDFSGLAFTPIDPLTGQPFPGGRIPQSRVDPSALALLNFIPTPNLPGTAQNYRRNTTSDSGSDGFSLRITHNFSGAAGRRGGGGGGRGGGAGRGGGRGGRGGNAVVLNAQAQYRNNDADSINVYPLLGGLNTTSSLSVPVTLNILRGRVVHNVQVTATRTQSASRNGFVGVYDVAGAAGISGVATHPSEWGVPNLSFSSLTSVRGLVPDERTDGRLQLGYTLTRPFQRHAVRLGGDARFDRSKGRNNDDARGTFVFTGLYTTKPGVQSTGLDFADFLLGLPQQASVQYVGDVVLQGQAFSLFAQDDWRVGGSLTVNLGVRYEVVRPYTEASGRMVNLDVAPDFTGAAPVVSGGTGVYTGSFPDALVNGDYNNVAPRVGIAWRLAPGTVVRAGFGTSFNNGSYASIARQLTAQPPFAVTNTSIGSIADPLHLADPFATVDESTTTNNFGADKNYTLGAAHTWNVDVNHNFGRGWQVGAGYTGTQGTHLDILRAPNRGPDGLRIEGVQAFLWESSEGRSMLHAVTFRLRRQQSRGVAGSVSYTLAKSMDDASSIGGGARVVAQNDQDLSAEWGLSSFDRRHQLTGNLSIELPFGPGRPWLAQGGTWSALLRDWRLAFNLSAQSGNPNTARILGAATDVARGTNGTLRADYTGTAIEIEQPTLLRFFNTAAFAAPAPGTFGSAARNTIIGPGLQQVDATVARDIRVSGNQVFSIQLQATNLFNGVRYGGIDTVLNSPTFGQVVSIRPMRTVQLNMRYRF